MAQLSSPINSVSMAVHLLVLVVSGIASMVKKLFRPEHRWLLRAVVVCGLVAIVGLGAYTGWMQDRPSGSAKQVHTAYQQQANYHLAMSNDDMPDVLISGWVTSFNAAQSLHSFQEHATQMDEVLPFWYRINKSGEVLEVNGVANKDELLSAAEYYNVKVTPTITNEFDPIRVSLFLEDDTLKNNAIAELVTMAEDNNYAGWDIDWEQFYAGDKKGFTAFVTSLATALHEHGKTLSVSVPVPSTAIRKSDQAEGYDYAEIAKAVDSVRLMAYDYHEGGSEPGPVTPLDEYEATLETIIKIVPPQKLIVGLPTYGYEWVEGRGEGFQFDQMNAHLEDNKKVAKRDAYSQELYASYRSGDASHVIWFEDAVSVRAKITIARAYNVRRITFWRLGGEDPALWKGL